jgi:hypothetical protein
VTKTLSFYAVVSALTVASAFGAQFEATLTASDIESVGEGLRIAQGKAFYQQPVNERLHYNTRRVLRINNLPRDCEELAATLMLSGSNDVKLEIRIPQAERHTFRDEGFNLASPFSQKIAYCRFVR